MIRVFIVFTLFLVSCSGSRIVHYINDRADYGAYQTYYLLNTKRLQIAEGDELIPRLETLINDQMEKRNYSVDSEDPDLLLRYELVATTETDINVNNSPVVAMNTASVNIFNESILLFELKDRRSNKLVWHGSIDMKDHQELKAKKDPIEAAVILVFDSYLYTAGTSEKDLSLRSNE